MAVNNNKLIQQTFMLLEKQDKASKDELASRARLLALALQQAERSNEELEVHNEVLKEAMEQVLESVRGHMDVKFKNPKGGYVVDITKTLKKALSPYADSANARSIVKTKKKGGKPQKSKKSKKNSKKK
ncbi:MAG: hypothetical protein OQK35_08210 [Alphaproteobacteria bacterium]|nr:hypothetical protein [Rhodospirillales bacterium]MCW9046302.1 hypothetical protein [Alphaproteobacteria bacterium]